ncbi:MAG: YjbQ family protein [Methanosarcinaceae archaeon]|nr:YjbQ family protein [Methanosarcinaceae archaeon]
MRIETKKRVELIDITDHVRVHVKESNVQQGICVVSTRHTTTAVIVNENENGLREDILSLLERLVPENAGYLHDRIDDNAHAHLRAVLLGSSVTLKVSDNRPLLGTWQSVFFVELDGPRTRTVDITAIGKQ